MTFLYIGFSLSPSLVTPTVKCVKMPTIWDYIHVGRDPPKHNLQEGLFQIASQTCSILVQVNNTNNISYGNNATNVQYNNFNTASTSSSSSNNPGRPSPSTSSNRRRPDDFSDGDQDIILLPSSSDRGSTKKLFSNYRHRLSVSFNLIF